MQASEKRFTDLLKFVTSSSIVTAPIEISLHTVNDHCKEIYARFNVNSATELAALFLRSI